MAIAPCEGECRKVLDLMPVKQRHVAVSVNADKEWQAC